MARTQIAPTSTPRPNRALVRNVTGQSSVGAGTPELVLDVRTAYDFFLSLMSEPDAELLPEDRAWLEASRASLSDGVKRDMALVFRQAAECKGYALMLVDRVAADPRVRTSADAVAMVGRLHAIDFLDARHDGDPAAVQRAVELGKRVVSGERGLLDEALAAWPADSCEAAEPLLRDPEGYLRATRRVLLAWQERFEPIEARIARFEQRDADSRRADFGRLPFSDFIEQATGGVKWVPQAGIERVQLAPTYFGRPYNWVFGGRDWHLYCYPIADSALDLDRGSAPASLVRLHRALGDDSRLRILRLLADGDLYLTEIAERMGLSKPTVSHHLAQLRASGLVSTTESGTLMYYSLRRERLAGVGPDLIAFLGPDLGASGPTRPRAD